MKLTKEKRAFLKWYGDWLSAPDVKAVMHDKEQFDALRKTEEKKWREGWKEQQSKPLDLKYLPA